VAISAAGVWGTGSYLPSARSAVPEPGTIALITLAGLAAKRRASRR